jgi:hypothetical protein
MAGLLERQRRVVEMLEPQTEEMEIPVQQTRAAAAVERRFQHRDLMQVVRVVLV